MFILFLCSLIIFIKFLLVLTVPSDPNPQNIHSKIFFSLKFLISSLFIFNDVFVTSSSMPTVKLCVQLLSKCENISFAITGVNSLLDRPYLPPITLILFILNNINAEETSTNNDSPTDPGSLVLSKTAIFFTVFGKVFINISTSNGLYNLTFINPTFSFFILFRYFTHSSIVLHDDPIDIMIFSAFLSPT